MYRSAVRVPSIRVWIAAAAGLFAAACGGDDEALPPDAGGGGDAGVSPDGGGDPGLLGRYDGPEDFDRLGCAPGSLAGLDPGGVWHHDLAFEGFGSFPALTRYDARTPGPGWTAWVNLGVTSGRETEDVRLTADDLFTRIAYVTDSGNVRVRTLDACKRQPDGSLWGKFAICHTEWEGCFAGTFTSVRVRRLPGEAEASGLVLLGEWAGDAAAPWGSTITVNVRVLDDVAYLARHGDGLRIVDVADPAGMRDLGWSPVADPREIYNDVKLVEASGKTYALMASNRRGVVTIDVTDPGSPVEKNTFPPIPEGEDHINVHTLFTERRGGQTRAYLTNLSTGGIDIYDVTNPLAPVRLGGYVHPDVENTQGAYVHDLYVENGRVFLNYWALGLVVVDALADPRNPTLVGQFDGYERRTNHSVWVTTAGGRTIAVMGDEDWGAHVRVVDVDTFELVGAFQLRPEVSVHNIMAAGERAYVAWYQDGLRILDLSDPAAPELAAYYNSWSGPGDGFYEGAIGLDLDLGANRIYLADTHRGLLVLAEP